MMRNILLMAFLILTINSCKESNGKNNEYIYRSGESIVQFEILSGKDYLIYDYPNPVNFKWTNTDPETRLIYGPGIKILETNNQITTAEINIPHDYLENDTLNIKLHYKVKGQIVNTEFNVPVKTPE